MSEFAGGGWGSVPSNDPEQRGDADGDGQRPAVNSEPFDRKYTSHGISPFKANDVEIVAKPSSASDIRGF
jgi:hypothetical protein